MDATAVPSPGVVWASSKVRKIVPAAGTGTVRGTSGTIPTDKEQLGFREEEIKTELRIGFCPPAGKWVGRSCVGPVVKVDKGSTARLILQTEVRCVEEVRGRNSRSYNSNININNSGSRGRKVVFRSRAWAGLGDCTRPTGLR